MPIADGLLREADDILHRSHIMLYTSRMLIDVGGSADGIRQGIATAEIGLEKAARKLADAAVIIARHEQEGEMNAILAELRLLQQQQLLLQAQLQQQRVAEAQAGAAGDVEQAVANIAGVVIDQLLQQGQEGAGDAERAGEAPPAAHPPAAAAAAHQQDAANDDADAAAEVGAAQQQAAGEAHARPQLQAAGVPPTNAAAGAAAAAAPQQQQHVPRVRARVDEATFQEVYVLLHLILRHQAELSVPDNMVPLLEDFIEEYLPGNPGQEDYPIRRYPPRDAADVFPLAPPRANPVGPHAAMYAGVRGMQRFRQPQQQQQQPRQQQRQEDDLADTCSSATCVSVP